MDHGWLDFSIFYKLSKIKVRFIKRFSGICRVARFQEYVQFCDIIQMGDPDGRSGWAILFELCDIIQRFIRYFSEIQSMRRFWDGRPIMRYYQKIHKFFFRNIIACRDGWMDGMDDTQCQTMSLSELDTSFFDIGEREKRVEKRRVNYI